MRKNNIRIRYRIVLKRLIKMILFFAMFCCVFSSGRKDVFAAKTGWVKAGSKYQYKVNDKYVKNKVYKISNKYYYFDKDGIRQTGWITYKKNKYYFDDIKGFAYTGKKKIGNNYYIFKNDGKLIKKQGYYTLKGKKYYINKNGKLAIGAKKIGKNLYYFDKKGHLVKKEGFYKYNNKQYYVKSNGKLAVGWYKVAGNKKYFDKQNGYMVTGRAAIGKKYYFFDNSGNLKNGIVEQADKKYYADTNGIVVQSKFINYNGKKYYANVDGVLVTGLETIKGKKYYFDNNAAMKTGIIKIGNYNYYFNANGEMVSNVLINVNNKKYYAGSEGILATGLKELNGKKYYFDNNAVMKTGIIKINNCNYYFNANGEMVTNALISINNKKYYADYSGALVTGMRIINDKKYYFKSDNSAQTGFLKYGENIYHFGNDGVADTGKYISVNGKRYYADASGRLKRNCWYDGYYFNNQGYIIEDAVVFDNDDEGLINDDLLNSLSLAKCTKLMIVAHPDDDTLWGGAHLAEGGYFVVCLTNENNITRKNEFLNVMQKSNNVGLILGYPDILNGVKSNWLNEKNSIARDIDTILNYKRWGLVVTHNPQGEYGHIHHKMTNKIVTEMYYKNYWSNNLYYFGKYYSEINLPKVADGLIKVSIKNEEIKKELLQLYRSQAHVIDDHEHLLVYENWIRASEW